MERQLLAMSSLYVPSVAVGAAVILTIPTLVALTNTKSKQQPLYEDRDGIATDESQSEAEHAGSSTAAMTCVIAVLGLITSVLKAQSQNPISQENRASSAWIGATLWALLFAQASGLWREASIYRRYRISIRGAGTCIITGAYFTCKMMFSSDCSSWCELLLSCAIPLLLLSFLSIPKRPTVYYQGQEVVNLNGCSNISWLSFTFGFLHQTSASNLPAKLQLSDVPTPCYQLRAKPLREQFQASGKGTQLWVQLLKSCFRLLIIEWTLVVCKAVSEFGSRYTLYRLLQCLERDMNSVRERGSWAWAGAMGGCLLGEVLADTWLFWISSGVLYNTATVSLQTLIFEKMTRKQHTISTTNGESNDHGSQSSPSITDMMFNDTHLASRAVLDNYHFVMAAFKIVLDVFYLTRLLSVKGVVIGAIFPILTTLLSKPLAKRHQLLQSEHSKAKSNVLSVLTEALQGLHQIRFSSLELFWQNRIKDVKTNEQDCKWAASVQLQKLNLVAGLGPVLLASTCISVHAWESGDLSPSVAFTAISLFGNLQGVFSQLPKMAASLHKSWLSIQRIQEFLVQPEQVRGAVPADRVFFENACFAWPRPNGGEQVNTYCLKNVTLSFPRGELSIVTGRVGSGKSLLLAALLDEAVMVSGRLGRPPAVHTTEICSDIIQGSTGFVSQPPWIDNCTIKQNIVFGYGFNAERYQKVLEVCALDQDLKSFSIGDETLAGAGGASLSGGQKWRIALARALYSPAEILILEDVLGAVDTPIAAWLCENALTGKVAEGRTIILATHRPEFCLSSASYHVTVEGGTATGTTQVPTTLLNHSTTTSSNKAYGKSEEKKETLPSEKTESSKKPPQQKTPSKFYWQSFVSYIRPSGLRVYLLGVLVTASYQTLNAGHVLSLARLTGFNDAGEQQGSGTNHSILVYLLLSIGSTIVVAVQSLVFVSIGLAASSSVFASAVQTILNATLGWIDSTPFGEVYQVLDNDMHVMDDLIAPAVNGILGTMLQLALIIVTSSWSNSYAAVISLTILVMYAYLGPQMMVFTARLRPLLGNCQYPLTDHTSSAAIGLITIRAFNRTEMYIERMFDLVDVSSKVGLHVIMSGCWAKTRASILGCIFVTATTATMVYNGVDASIAGFTISLAFQLKSTIATLLSQWSTTRMGFMSVDRLLALKKIPKESKQGLSMGHQWPERGSIEVHDLTVRYRPELPPTLKGITFSVQPQKRVGIVGGTGAGKTSLTSALLRFVEANGGEVLIDGVNIADIKLENLRGTIRLIPQDPFLFSGTLRSNLDTGRGKKDGELISALRRVHLINSDDELSKGTDFDDLDMTIESGGSNLSHGQRQLICLARAILAHCRILILDEATSGIDSTSDAAIQQIIKDEFSSATVMVVAHKLLTVADFDSILVLSEGEVVEFGAPKELLEKEGVFWDMVNRSGVKEKLQAVIKGSM